MAYNQKKQKVGEQYNIVINNNGKKTTKRLYVDTSSYSWGLTGSGGEVNFSIDDNEHTIVYQRDEPVFIKLYVDGRKIFERDSLIPIGSSTFNFEIDGIDCEFYYLLVAVGVIIKIRVGGIQIFSE